MINQLLRSLPKAFLPLCILLTMQGLMAQSTDSIPPAKTLRTFRPFSFGILGGMSFIGNSTNLNILPGSPDCGTFANGNASGIFGGIQAQYELIPGLLHASARVMMSKRPAVLTQERADFEVFDAGSGLYKPLVIEHEYNADLSYLVLDAGFIATPIDDFPLYLRLAADAGDPIFTNTYTQTELIESPASALFPGRVKKRTTFSGPAAAGTAYGVSAGAGISVEFQPGLFIVPEFRYRQGLNSINEERTWNISSFDISLGLMYRFGEEKTIPAEIPITPPPPPPPPPPAIVNLKPPIAIGSISGKPLEVQETIVTQTFPLLPYIFFDSSDFSLKSNYAAKDSFTSEQNLSRETLPTYYNVLNIVGGRLKDKNKAILTITGTSDGREAGNAAKRRILALKRAEAVKQYLMKNWNIPATQIKTESRDLPELASADRYSEGNEENRRAELSSDDPGLLQPVIHSRFQEYAAIHKMQKFSTATDTLAIVQQWNLELFTPNGTLIRTENGLNAPPAELSIEFGNEEMKKLGQLRADSVQAKLKIIQNDGTQHSSICTVPIVKSQYQFEVSRLSLIVFDFDQSVISDQNKQMMRTFVQEALRPNSQATITGSTDKLGEAKYNKELSTARAQAVNSYLVSIKPDAQITSVRGIGASILPFDNALPEGRYYCRTVSVEVKTPLQTK
jgi:outer membrane protein OmpA-like peptidoglycan-associated protein